MSNGCLDHLPFFWVADLSSPYTSVYSDSNNTLQNHQKNPRKQPNRKHSQQYFWESEIIWRVVTKVGDFAEEKTPATSVAFFKLQDISAWETHVPDPLWLS